ncbi:DNA polymerase III subunit delta [Lentibacillus sp. Marseille-P4043]|uniref:DNA polymerase III subunit delta n=1 Tax=Lentibacillus sp. Marseille-P4043 TaxID=2040293 RepID=UPI000D0AF08A|nr:DNA polymerase III subunit delta [Lentibacillus sp. Marseille-P4043]
MAYMDVLKQVKNKQISPIYLLYGSDSYFIQNLKKQITKAVLPTDDYENLVSYDLAETPIQEVISDAETYPFFGEKKLIIANNPTFLKAKPDKLPFDHDINVLQNYIENPVDYSVVVFIATYEKIDERKKISKLLKKHGAVANCSPIKEQEVSKWIKNQADNLNITIAPEAYDILEGEISTNLHLLQNELTKLALYVGEGGNVTREIAESLVSHTTNSSSLRLVDAVIGRDIHKAISIFKDLEKMKEEPIALIGLLAFQFRTIFRVKLLKQKGYSQFQMQKQLGVHPYVVKIAYSRESKFTIDVLQTIMDKLTEADTAMKQGKMEKELAFELLLYDLIQTR